MTAGEVSTEARWLYMTMRNAEEAETIAKALVGERLVACANILDGMKSFYWWDDAVQSDDELVLIAKTQASQVDAVVARVKALHTDDCPCIVALPIVGGNADFLNWIAAETGKPA